MALNVGGDEGGMLAQINTTPLVDVMLVLLIIFLITIPVVTQQVPVKLPTAANIPTETRPENITISVDANGATFWNNSVVDKEALLERLKTMAVKVPQPEVHVRADKEVRYEYVGRVVVLCQRAGIQKVGFITEPGRPAGTSS